MVRVRSLMTVVTLGIVTAACSTPAGLPEEFDAMASVQVGCTAVVGDAAPYVLGPLGVGEQEVYAYSDGLSALVEVRTAGTTATVTEYSQARGEDTVQTGVKG